ncbi:hypothetical protein ACWEQG_01455 [Microbispora sp. NPDC004025]
MTKLNTVSRWTDRMAAELAQMTQELADARTLIALQFRALNIDPDDLPPGPLVEAWHTRSHADRPVTVDMDGIEVTLVVSAEPQPDDAVREALHWQQLRRAFRRVRTELGRAS